MQQRVPDSWDSSNRPGHAPYVLVEDDDPALALSDFSLFREEGFVVALCGGPGDDPTACPLLRGEDCAILGGADVVLHRLADDLALAGEIRHCRPDLPVITVSSARHGDPDQAKQSDSGALAANASVDEQLHALNRALAHHRRNASR